MTLVGRLRRFRYIAEVSTLFIMVDVVVACAVRLDTVFFQCQSHPSSLSGTSPVDAIPEEFFRTSCKRTHPSEFRTCTQQQYASKLSRPGASRTGLSEGRNGG